MLTRSQQYAARIFEQVSELRTAQEATRKKYGSTALRLPVLVRTAGLAQALAFVESKEPGQQLLCHLAAVLGEPDRTCLLERSRKAGLLDYMHLTYKVSGALIWYSRFAQSVLGIKPGDEPEEGERE